MDADGLPIVGPGVDYTKVEAIQQKRTIAFINHFITHTSRFLNRFSCVCEEKLEGLACKIQRLEISLSILEAKLSSIPGLENVTVEPSSSTPSTAPVSNGPVAPQSTSGAPTSAQPVSNGPTPDTTEPAVEPEDTKPKMTNSQDPRYMRFFKMLQVGVPVPAVKMKMSAEGFNPDIIDNPDGVVTDGGEVNNSSNKPGNQDSDSDFSDDGNNNDSDSDSVSSFSD